MSSPGISRLTLASCWEPGPSCPPSSTRPTARLRSVKCLLSASVVCQVFSVCQCRLSSVYCLPVPVSTVPVPPVTCLLFASDVKCLLSASAACRSVYCWPVLAVKYLLSASASCQVSTVRQCRLSSVSCLTVQMSVYCLPVQTDNCILFASADCLSVYWLPLLTVKCLMLASAACQVYTDCQCRMSSEYCARAECKVSTVCQCQLSSVYCFPVPSVKCIPTSSANCEVSVCQCRLSSVYCLPAPTECQCCQVSVCQCVLSSVYCVPVLTVKCLLSDNADY